MRNNFFTMTLFAWFMMIMMAVMTMAIVKEMMPTMSKSKKIKKKINKTLLQFGFANLVCAVVGAAHHLPRLFGFS